MKQKKLKMIWASIFLGLSFLNSCSAPELRRVTRNEGSAQEFGQVSEFFLPYLPSWANFSVAGQCFRSRDIQFLNYQRLSSSYSLAYKDLVELQAIFNQAYHELENNKVVNINEKNALLYELVEKQSGGIRYFELPNYNVFYLVWIDRMSEVELEKWLKSYRESDKMANGVPVLLSLCYTKSDISKKLKEWKLDSDFPYVLPAEVFSTYNHFLSQGPRFTADLSGFFPEKAEIFLVTQEVFKRSPPKEILLSQGFKVVGH